MRKEIAGIEKGESGGDMMMTYKHRCASLVSTSLLGCCVIAQPAAAQQVPATASSAAVMPTERSQPSAGEPTAPASTAAPQGDLDPFQEIVVTAERRTSTVQRTAASLSVRSGAELLEQGRYQLKNILETVPGITGGAAENSGTSAGSGTDNPASGLVIRGIPSNQGAGGGATSTAAAAALYTDNVYNGVGSTYDIDRVEILRGPQGTLYGRSATSGVVAFHTRDPNLERVDGSLAAEIGNYQLRHYTGGVSVPLVPDMLAVRVSGNYYKQGGYYFGNMGGGRINRDARVKLLFKPAENFTALLGFALEDNKTYDGGSQSYQTNCNSPEPKPNTYCITPDTVTPGTNKFRQYWGEFNLDLGLFGITYIPAYRTWEQNFVADGRNSPALKVYQTIRTPSDYFHTQELRLHSNRGSALQWQVGGMYYYNKLHDRNTLTVYATPTIPAFLAFDAENRKTTLSLGVFAEATYAVEPSTRITGGLRYDYTRVRTDEVYSTGAPPNMSVVTKSISGEDATRRFRNVTYKARVEHDLAPANLVYASVSTGVSPGDVSITTDAMTFQPTVLNLKAKTLTAYEVGSKNRFLGGKLQVNGAVFYNDYAGYQVASVNLSGNALNPAFSVISTKLRSYGFEFDAVVSPWAHGRLTYNMSYTNAEFRDIPAQYQAFFARSRVPGVPPFQATLAYDHEILLGDAVLSLNGELRYRSSYDAARYTVEQAGAGAAPFIRTGDDFIGNLSATLALPKTGLSLTAYVRNVGNKRYKSFLIPNTLKDTFTGTTIGHNYSTTLSDPRTIGIIASVKF
jgi:iron complex outermembrane receptor protein